MQSAKKDRIGSQCNLFALITQQPSHLLNTTTSTLVRCNLLVHERAIIMHAQKWRWISWPNDDTTQRVLEQEPKSSICQSPTLVHWCVLVVVFWVSLAHTHNWQVKADTDGTRASGTSVFILSLVKRAFKVHAVGLREKTQWLRLEIWWDQVLLIWA